MGRHSLPDQYGAGGSDPRPRARRRTVAIATVLVLTVAGGTAAAVQGGLLSFGSSCQDEAVRIEVAASPDVAPALRAAAARAHDENLTSDGRCVDISVTARESYKVRDTLAAGKNPGAQVWVPDSDVWLGQIAANTGATEVARVGNVASSPVGMAMVPAAAKSLGWPKKTYGWLELAGAGLRDDSLRLGAADPARSASGLLALTQLSSAAGQAEDGATQAAAMMKTLSQRISDSDGQLVETLPRDASGTEQGNPKRNQALVLSEQAAFAYNSAAESAEGLDFFYPEGRVTATGLPVRARRRDTAEHGREPGGDPLHDVSAQARAGTAADGPGVQDFRRPGLRLTGREGRGQGAAAVLGGGR
ncbi:hypothetical protein M2164_007180 [Streptomyces sp. SAI-208]|nr:hypothetical protein [Streptomyces sp. SAI-208]